jgi:hypothetical protein
VPGDTPVLALGGIVSRERGQNSPGPFEHATAGGSAVGNTGAGGVSVGGMRGARC